MKTPICCGKSRLKDEFNSTIKEDVFYNGNVLLPKDSALRGNISQIKRHSCFRRDSSVCINITEIETPDGEKAYFENDPLVITLVNPYAKPYKKRLLERAPSTVAQYATSIALTAASNLGTLGITGIATGAAATCGLVSGYLSPDPNSSRSAGALRRGFECTTPGTAYVIMSKRYNVNFDADSVVQIILQEQQMAKIKNALLNNSMNAPQTVPDKQVNPIQDKTNY